MRILSQSDVNKLLTDSSEATRADTAAKIAAEFQAKTLSPRERAIAEDILRRLTVDISVRVRKALSESLKACSFLPRDMALALSHDVDEVAVPILEGSPVLLEADLIALVRQASEPKQTAVASREEVSEALSNALIDTGREGVVAQLVSNSGAVISDGGLARVLDDFGYCASVTTPLVHRQRLPVTVAERLLALVSDALRQHLVAHHDLSPSLAADVILQTRERAMVGLLEEGAEEQDVEGLVLQLRLNGRLTPSLVVRALCMGDVAFFEASMAALARVPLANARTLIHDRGPLGLEALYAKAGLPEAMFEAVRTAVSVIHETAYDGGPNDRDRFRVKVMERILTQFEHLGTIGPETLDYLIAKLEKYESEGFAA
ncbi:MAG: DUF2336 domain-containing protein [Alphaproteobacteria bacterium]